MLLCIRVGVSSLHGIGIPSYDSLVFLQQKISVIIIHLGRKVARCLHLSELSPAYTTRVWVMIVVVNNLNRVYC